MNDPPSESPAEKTAGRTPGSVRQVLLRGVFWRILAIEMILLAWSVGYMALTKQTTAIELAWYALRIIVLVAIIIAFVVLTLRRFLNQKIVLPLEAITAANLHLNNGAPMANPVPLPPDTPTEIRQIVDTRQKMLETIIQESTQRLKLVHFIRDTFGRYISKQVVDQILTTPEGLKLGGKRKTVTILMADLRGFTGMAENRDPQEVMQVLNRFFAAMSKIIVSYDGMIDEFLGDAILTIFGVPERHEDDPARAVACALDMQNAMVALNREIVKDGFAYMEMGIGINTGSVIVGNIGSELRAKYGIVGTAVNTAARIESMTTGGQVLIGESTYWQAGSTVTVGPPQTVQMKGMAQPLVCYPVHAIGEPYRVRLNAPEPRHRGVPMRLALQCWIVQDKVVQEPAFSGQTLYIAQDVLLVVLEKPQPALTDIKIHLAFCTQVHCFEAMYAKVIDTQVFDGQSVNSLRITAISSPDRAVLSRWVAQAR
jgi:adenylate cyclase